MYVSRTQPAEYADLKFHLAVLKRFVALCKVVEAKGTDAEMKSKLLQQFLVCAEARYIRYLALLDEFAYGFNGKGGTFAQTMPLPPWYPLPLVAIV
jgi:hypothetical protein